MENVKLTFQPDALEAVVELAMTKKTGARSLRAILEEVMLEVMFQAPVQIGLQEVVITKATVKEKTLPIYVQGKESKQSA
jgi:ATP-dependent Clp protease ATP-binding subunit ClpX